MNPKYVDTHSHIHFNVFKQDMDEVIQRTLRERVFMITVGTQKDTSRAGVEIAERYDGLWSAVGLHPNHLTKQEFADEGELETVKTRTELFDKELYRTLAQSKKCVAIGETGLDYFRIPDDANQDEVKKLQAQTVREHFDLATELSLPVIIHCRDAYKEQAEIVEEYVADGKLRSVGVVHCFTGTLEEARLFIKLGFYISFTGIVTFPAKKNDSLIDGLSPLQNVAKNIPLEKMLIETDSPYLTPVPQRGKRNEPMYVKHVAEKIAQLHDVSLDDVASATTNNAYNLFGLN